MKCFNKLIVDLDGVVWRGKRPINENIEALRKVLQGGGKIVFLTNNSTRHRAWYAKVLSQLLDYPIRESDVVNSGYSASLWLLRHYGRLNVLPVGEPGLVVELEKCGHTVLIASDWENADAVAVGLNRHVTYSELAAAHKAIMKGALFVATNRDSNYPVEDSTEPGAGSIVALLETSTGKKADVDTGKPSKWILDLSIEALGGGEPLVIGDRLDTDWEMARRAGIPMLLVLTGVTTSPPAREPQAVSNLREALVGDRICLGE